MTSIAANTTANAAGILTAGDDITIRARLDEDVDVSSFTGAAGFVGLGAAVVVVNDTTLVQAQLGDGAQVIAADTISILTVNNQTFDGQTGQISAGAVAIGASFVRVDVANDGAVENFAGIGNNVTIGVAGPVKDILVQSTSNLDAEADTFGLSAGIGAGTANFAFVDLASQVFATIGSGGDIRVNGKVELKPTLNITGDAQATGAAVGGIAIGATLADVTAGGGNGVEEIVAQVGASTKVDAKTLLLVPMSHDDLVAETTAGAGGVIAAVGAVATIDSDLAAVARIGSGADITVETLSIQPEHHQDVNSRADSVTIALAAGTGASVDNTVTSKSNIDIGGGTTIAARNIFLTASNFFSKERFNRSIRAATVSATVSGSGLGSDTDLGTAANPFESAITIGPGARLTASGGNNVFRVSTVTDFDFLDSVKAEGVSALSGVTYAVSSLDAHTASTIHVDGAILENLTGDLTLAARGEGNSSTDSNLLVASGLTGAALSNADSNTVGTQRIDLDNATIKGRDVDIQAGRGATSVPNDFFSRSASNVLTFSLIPSIADPQANSIIVENNVIDIQGTSKVLAFEDVNLITDETPLAAANAGIDGGAASLSLIPYGVGVQGTESFSANNQVLVGNSAHIESGIHSTAVVQIKPLTFAGQTRLSAARLNTPLTPGEKTSLGIPADIDYEYAELDVTAIGLDVRTGYIIQVVSGANQGGTVGTYYRYKPETFESTVRITPHLVNYSNSAVWENLGVLTPTQISDFETDGSPTYPSNVTLDLAAGLDNKFFVVKPTEMQDVKISYINVGNRLFEQREKILDWIANHAGNAEAIARYQVQLEVLNQTLADLGLTEMINGALHYRRDLDILILDLPNITAAPGSIFIEAKSPSSATFAGKVGTQLIARPGARVNVLNESPFAMNVNDVLVRDNRKVTHDQFGNYLVLEGGNVYVNNGQLTNVTDTTDRIIEILQDAEGPISQYDLSGLPVQPSNIDQDMYINGDVINEAGDVLIDNREGSIYVNGTIRGEQVTILAARDFTLNSEDWFHTNQDPRQYLDWDEFRAPLFNLGQTIRDTGLPLDVPPTVFADGTFAGHLNDGTPSTLDAAIARDESKILAQGKITITARYLNIDGLIQSGVETIEFDVASNFVPPAFTSNFTDDDGSLLAGISFGSDGVPIDGYWDSARNAIVLEDIEPDGGQIVVAGQILSTGNGRLKVANGYTNVDINNQSPYELILGNIDTTTNRQGRITIIDSGMLTKAEYIVDGGQIRETRSTGVLNPGDPVNGIDDDADGDTDDGQIPSIVYTPGAPLFHNFGDSIQYLPPADLHYVWTEGQEKLELDKRVYEKKSFNLVGEFLADELAADNSWKSRQLINLDDEPLLESESASVEGAIGAGGEQLVPPYANGAAYSIAYDQRRDTSVELIPNVTLVRHPANASGVVYRYVAAELGDLILADIDYAADSDWADSGNDPAAFTEDPANSRYDSDYVNYEKDVWGPHCTGGGWLRTKTCTTKIDITQGLKDFYTHSLKADYPIDILFTAGTQTPSISLVSAGGLTFEANMLTPNAGTVLLSSSGGDIVSVPSVALFGPTPTVIASNGEVLLTIEGDQGALNVLAQGDIDITAISADNVSSSLAIGTVNSLSGNVYLNGPSGITAASGSSVILGETIELLASSGVIGSQSLPIRIDSNRSGGSLGGLGVFSALGPPDGFAAQANGNIAIEEISGDLILVSPIRSTANVSVESVVGDVRISVVDGSLLDGINELFKPVTTFSYGSLDPEDQQFINQGASSGLWSINAINFTVSPGLMTFLYPHAPTLGSSPSSFAVETTNIVADDVILTVPGSGGDVGVLRNTVAINNPLNHSSLSTTEKELLSIANASDVIGIHYALYEYLGANENNVDLEPQDFGDTGRWKKINVDFRTGADTGVANNKNVSTGDTVLVQFDVDDFGLYEYLGTTGSINLTAENYNVASRWQRVTADHSSADGSIQLDMGDFVFDKHVVESLSLRLFDKVNIDASGGLTVTANDRVAVASPTAMRIVRIEAGGDVRLTASTDIVDTGIAVAAIATKGQLEMRAGSQIKGTGGNPLRTQIANSGLLRADAVAGIEVLQVAADTTINGLPVPINSLLVSRADSMLAIDIEVAQGDMTVGRITSATSVDLTAAGSILDAFNDTGAEVVNVFTSNALIPPSGDVTLTAGADIGQSGNFLDIRIPLGKLISTSVGDQFIHSVQSLNVENVTSTGGDATLDVDGAANVQKISTLAGTTTIVADDEIVDIEADAASDIDAINVVLTSIDNRIGDLLNDLEINTANAGALSAVAALDISVVEIEGSLTVLQASSNTLGYVRLTVVESALLGEDLIVPVAGVITVADGALLLQVGDNVQIDGSVDAPKHYIFGDYRNLDPTGTTISILGTLSGGTAWISGDLNADTMNLVGATSPLKIKGFGGDDTITGGSGPDEIDGGAGVDLIAGGPGNDVLIAGSGIGDQLHGNEGDDRIFGSDDGAETDPDFSDATRFGDLITGGPGNDTIWGLGGADHVDGGDDDDIIDGGVGSDMILGGAGDDQIFAGAGLAHTIDSGPGDDVVWGSHNGNDTILAGSGDDRVFAQGGDDFVDGQAGHDLIDGGPGTDDLRGGDGEDELIGGGGVGDQLRGDAGDDLLLGSDDGADLMLGGSGRDRAYGQGGNDVIEGGDGNDILDGGPGDDLVSGDAGSDVLLGGGDHDVLYALNAGGVGADMSVDYVYGDYGTGNDEPGSGRDQLFGDAGIDLLFGEGDDDLIDDDTNVAGIPDPATTIDTIVYGSGEAADPTQFVAPTPTAAPAVDPPGPGLVRGQSTLPSGVDDFGRWSELAGSASRLGLSGDAGTSRSPSIAIRSQGPLAAWSDSRDGNQEIYVAQHTASGWTELSGSAGHSGISNTEGGSTLPSIAVDATDAPIVAWTESHASGTDIRVARYDATAGGGAGAWLPLGTSLSTGGISGTSAATSPQVIDTSFGVVVGWLEDVAGTTQVHARVFVGGSWQELAGSATGGGVSSVSAGADLRDFSITQMAGRVAVSWTALDGGGIRQVYLREYNGVAWNELAGSATGAGTSQAIIAVLIGQVTDNTKPSVAYHGGNLWAAWTTQSDQGSVIAVVEYDGSAGQPVVRDTLYDIGLIRDAKLNAGGGQLRLTWLHQPLTPTRPRSMLARGTAVASSK